MQVRVLVKDRIVNKNDLEFLFAAGILHQSLNLPIRSVDDCLSKTSFTPDG